MAEEKEEEIYRGPSIRVSTSGIATKLQEFKVEMDNMNRILEEVKTSTKNAKNYWKGEESEATFGEIDIFQQKFDEINNNNKKREEFLKNIKGNTNKRKSLEKLYELSNNVHSHHIYAPDQKSLSNILDELKKNNLIIDKEIVKKDNKKRRS